MFSVIRRICVMLASVISALFVAVSVLYGDSIMEEITATPQPSVYMVSTAASDNTSRDCPTNLKTEKMGAVSKQSSSDGNFSEIEGLVTGYLSRNQASTAAGNNAAITPVVPARTPVPTVYLDELVSSNGLSKEMTESSSLLRITGRVKASKVENGCTWFELVPSYPQDAPDDQTIVVKWAGTHNLQPQRSIVIFGRLQGTCSNFGKERKLFAADEIKV